MGAGVVSIGRKKYAVGLYWQVAPAGRVTQLARETARQGEQIADFFAVRRGAKSGRLPQFGLGQVLAGHKIGMPTLAATVANLQPGSWAGAFKLREGVVVVVVRDDLITPDGDQLYADETEARNRLLQEMGLGGLQRVYAPESWSIPSSDGMPLALILQNRAESFLQPVAIPRHVIIGGAIAVGLLLAVVGGGLYWQNMKEEEEQLRIQQMGAEARARVALQQQMPLSSQKVQYPPPIRYWEDAPNPVAFVEACRAALDIVPQALLGWQISSARCVAGVPGSLTVVWTREPGFTYPIPEGSINETATSASRTVVLAGLSRRGAENLLDPKDVTELYLMQNWSGQISRVADDPPPPPPPNVPPEQWNPPPPPWVKRGVSLSQQSLPGELPLYFGHLPGAIISSLTFSGGNWTVEGVIYENRR